MKWSIFLWILLLGSCRVAEKTVHLQGSLKEFDAETVNFVANGAAGDISDIVVVTVKVNEDGMFDITFPLEQAVYCQVGRNTLYLSPGDDMEVYLSTNQTESWFKGRGAEANTYLTNRLFPKSGAFLKGGKNVKPEFDETRMLIDSLASARREELNHLDGVGGIFREFEEIRLKADLANSYLSYISYAGEYFFKEGMSQEEIEGIAHEYYLSVCPEVVPLLEDIAADERYLEIPDVRDVLSMAMRVYPEVMAPLQSERFKELRLTGQKKREMNKEMTPSLYQKLKQFTSDLQQEDLKQAFLNRLERRAQLMKGRPAIDLEIMTPDGKQGKLRDYKGRILYVDFWATWCGPCMAEMPDFNELSVKYPHICFVGISLDEDEKAWRNKIGSGNQGEVIEVLCHDSRTKTGWDIAGIPRFLLIDEDFNIISSDAPRPSQKDLIEPLLEKYSGKL